MSEPEDQFQTELYVVGEGKTRDEAVANALKKVAWGNAETEVDVLREGMWSLFEWKRISWRVRVTNLDAVQRRQERERAEEARAQEERERAQQEEERERKQWALLDTIRTGLPSCGEDDINSDEDWYEFSYPFTLRLRYKTLASAAKNAWFGDAQNAVNALANLKGTDKETREQARDVVVQSAAEGEMFLVLAMLACKQNGWLEELEASLRADDRFLDVVKLLIFCQKWQALHEWFEQHSRYSECVLLLEKMKQFPEAVALLEKIGPEGYCESFSEEGNPRPSYGSEPHIYNRKLSQLKGYAKAAGGDAPKVLPAAEEVERAFALGEISEEERKLLKKRGKQQEQVPCAKCGKPIESNSAFCPFCGAKR